MPLSFFLDTNSTASGSVLCPSKQHRFNLHASVCIAAAAAAVPFPAAEVETAATAEHRHPDNAAVHNEENQRRRGAGGGGRRCPRERDVECLCVVARCTVLHQARRDDKQNVVCAVEVAATRVCAHTDQPTCSYIEARECHSVQERIGGRLRGPERAAAEIAPTRVGAQCTGRRTAMANAMQGGGKAYVQSRYIEATCEVQRDLLERRRVNEDLIVMRAWRRRRRAPGRRRERQASPDSRWQRWREWVRPRSRTRLHRRRCGGGGSGNTPSGCATVKS